MTNNRKKIIIGVAICIFIMISYFVSYFDMDSDRVLELIKEENVLKNVEKITGSIVENNISTEYKNKVKFMDKSAEEKWGVIEEYENNSQAECRKEEIEYEMKKIEELFPINIYGEEIYKELISDMEIGKVCLNNKYIMVLSSSFEEDKIKILKECFEKVTNKNISFSKNVNTDNYHYDENKINEFLEEYKNELNSKLDKKIADIENDISVAYENLDVNHLNSIKNKVEELNIGYYNKYIDNKNEIKNKITDIENKIKIKEDEELKKNEEERIKRELEEKQREESIKYAFDKEESIKEISKVYYDNKLRGNKEYFGKKIKVTAQITSINSDSSVLFNTGVTVNLEEKGAYYYMMCNFKDGDSTGILNYNRGDMITIIGTMDELIGNSLCLKKCIIVK